MVRKLIILAILITCVFLSLETAQSAGAPVSKVTVKEYIVKHSMEMGIDPALALSLAKQESGFCHELKSPYGAVGVFQLLPSTAKKLGYNPYYLSENIKGGLKYYQMMYKQFGSVELALAAYNAGPANVAKYKGMPPFKETKSFVNQIMAEYKNQKNNPDPAITKYKNVKNTETVLKQKAPITPVSHVLSTDEKSSKPKENESVIELETNMPQKEPIQPKDLLSMKL